MARKHIVRDLTDKNGQRYIEVVDGVSHDERCSRDCTFFRRGECWLHDYLGNDVHCMPGYIWERVDNEGYILDRDGWRGWMDCPENLQIRIDAERYVIDREGNRELNKRGVEYKY